VRVYPTKRSPKSQARIASTLVLALTLALAAAGLAAASQARLAVCLAVLRWSWSIAIEIMSVTEALAEADLIVKEMVAISLKWFEGAGTTTFFVRVVSGQVQPALGRDGCAASACRTLTLSRHCRPRSSASCTSWRVPSGPRPSV